MKTPGRAIAALVIAGAMTVMGQNASASGIAPLEAGRWTGEWSAVVRVDSRGELAGEAISSRSQTVVSGRLGAEIAGGPMRFEVPVATWSYRGTVSYLSSETTGEGSLEGGELVLADGEQIAPGARLVWRDERRVGSLRTVVRPPSGEQFVEGPIDLALEPVIFTVTTVTPTAVSGTIDVAPLAKGCGQLPGETVVDGTGAFELRLVR